jgi:hypothetical protein
MIIYPDLLKHSVQRKPASEAGKNVTLFWRLVLERISIGDPPFGTQIINHSLIYTRRSRSDSSRKEIPLKTTTPSEIISFFEKFVGVQLEYVYFDSWKEIKRKVIKDNLIQDYVTRFQLEHNLTNQQTNYLSSLIHLYITLKRITPEDITLEIVESNKQYRCTRIKSISGIYYSNQDNIVKFSNKRESPPPSDDEEDYNSEEEEETVTNEEEDVTLEDDNIE